MTTEAQATKEAAVKAKIAAKAAKLEAAAAKKAEKEAALKAKTEAAEKAKADKAAAVEAKKAEAQAALEARAAARAAAKAAKAESGEVTGTKMGALRDRVASGAYVKGANGQMRSNDEVALALEAVPAKQVVTVLLDVLGLDENPYAALNYGQQSMNLRNRLRGAVRKGAEINGVKVDLTHVQARIAALVAPEVKATAEPETATA